MFGGRPASKRCALVVAPMQLRHLTAAGCDIPPLFGCCVNAGPLAVLCKKRGVALRSGPALPGHAYFPGVEEVGGLAQRVLGWWTLVCTRDGVRLLCSFWHEAQLWPWGMLALCRVNPIDRVLIRWPHRHCCTEAAPLQGVECYVPFDMSARTHEARALVATCPEPHGAHTHEHCGLGAVNLC